MARISSPISYALFCTLCYAGLLAQGCADGGGKSPRDAGSEEDAGEVEDGGAGEDAADDGGEDATDAGEEPLSGKARLKGRVTFADGTALGQVDIRIGGKRYKSDSRGVFSADDLPEGELEVAIEDDASSAAQLKVDVSEERITQAELFVLPMKKVAVADVEAGGETAAGDSVKVKLQASALRLKRTGEAAAGAAEARFALTKESRDMKAAPGRLTGTRDDVDVELESFGMIDMRFFQGDEELELTKEAELELPLGPNTFSEGQEVDAWSFDAQRGKWKLENRAVIDKSTSVNGVAKINATHFSWWTIAQPAEEQTCLSGRLLSANAEPLPHLWVQAVGTTYWGTTWAETDADGTFCLNAKQATTYSLSAFGTDSSAYFEWKQDATAGSSAGVCGGETACTALGDISGSSLFDECQGNVTDDQDHVLLLSSTDATLDMQVEAMLSGLGHTVSVGPHYSQFDGTFDMDPYDAVYLQANASWSGDMPVEGQRQLINWVNCGGGLVTTEWTTWKIGSGGFQLIDAIFPAVRTTNYGSPTMQTYTRVEDEPTLNAGLPDSFTFTTTNFSGTESYLNPRPGAAIYYDSDTFDSGLLGWEYNLGRVASFSTTVGGNEIQDPNFSRLLANTLDWVQRD